MIAALLVAAVFAGAPHLASFWDPARCACLPVRCNAVMIRRAEPLALVQHGSPSGCVRRSNGAVRDNVCVCVAWECRRAQVAHWGWWGTVKQGGCGSIRIL